MLAQSWLPAGRLDLEMVRRRRSTLPPRPRPPVPPMWRLRPRWNAARRFPTAP